ncbi:hypothetical protein EUX98_g7687 [Antrodiella citrinella]|uniref:TauD/TfdA-like domain-containing protein n=1 Tax=Antrodiella citrinella TaxID=2447956 RepID=A0A4V3XHT0_9APHY|nr:hypothetical protein EUX98_g7687 [Antrodiella citrinella]
MTVETVPLQFPASLDADLYRDFGREIRGVDVSKMTEDEFAEIERLLYQHDLLVFRDCDLSPEQQYALTKAFDPSSENYGHGNNKVEKSERSLLRSLLTTLPNVPQVQLIGNGLLENHEGIPNITLKHPSHRTFHRTPHLSAEDEDRGITRFYRWHMDAALYEFAPPKVTTLYGVRVPDAPTQTCRYDDGSTDELEVSLGATAFVSGRVMFDILPPELKSLAVRTRIQYAPHPFVWMSSARAKPTGLGLETEGLEVAYESLPQWEASKVQTLPMVWKNPVTNGLHLQSHPCAATQLFVDPVPETASDKTSPPHPLGTQITNLQEVRDILHEIQRPAIAPRYVYPHNWNQKDLVIFHNRGVLHSALGSFKPDQIRVFHQCNLAASDFPLGPSLEDVNRWS